MKVELVADSPKKAFYRLEIYSEVIGYSVKKESGCQGIVTDRRIWQFTEKGKAEEFLIKKIHEKTNRTHGRVYSVRFID